MRELHAKRVRFSHVRVFSDSRNLQKSVARVIYLGPLLTGGFDHCEIKHCFRQLPWEGSKFEDVRHAAGSVRSDRGRPAGRPAHRRAGPEGPLQQAVSTHTQYIFFFNKLCRTYMIVYVRCARGCAKSAPPAHLPTRSRTRQGSWHRRRPLQGRTKRNLTLYSPRGRNAVKARSRYGLGVGASQTVLAPPRPRSDWRLP